MTQPDATAEVPAGRGRVREWFDIRFRSATAIYGLIVFTSFITIASDDVTESGHPIDAFELFVDAIPALLVFYAAHVFAHTLTDHGEHGFGRAFVHALHHSSGMLWSAIPTFAIILIGVFTNRSAAQVYWYAMMAAVAMLVVLGYAAYSRRGSHVVIRLLGGIGTGLLGLVIIILEYALH